MTELLGTYTLAGLRDSALLRGGASAMDLRGNTRRQYRMSPSPAAADLGAIRNDWSAVDADLRSALTTARKRRRRVEG